nr:heavy metal translocating P-type ATPase [Roseomonas acroporae]
MTAAAGTLRPQGPPAFAAAPLARDLGNGAHELELMVSGLTCGACVWLLEQALGNEPDVTRARANLSSRRLTLRWRGPAGRADEFVRLIARLGFRPAPWSPACLRAEEDAEQRELVRALGIAGFGAMNVMLVSVAVWAGSDMGEATRALMHWLAMLFALPTVLVAGMPFYKGAWRGLRAGRPTMDLAVSLGVLLTTAMSVSETLRNADYTWFDGATALLALLLVGRVLDRAARRRARQAAAGLLALQEGTVTRLEADGAARPVPPEAVAAGERILVAAGETVRLDGVLEGEEEAVLDLAATTGESLPRHCPPGEAVPAGGVNLGQPFTLRVTAAAKDGSLAATARLLERAEGARGRTVALADRAAGLYVPVVHAVSLATFLGWWLLGGVTWQAALVPAVAALIITCPCGLAIAVPAVQVVAAGALFRRGVLLASPDALERLAQADHAVLDKTGTLTEGRPELLPGGAAAADDLALAASLAAASRHPLARALRRACPDAPAATGVREHPGLGLERDGVRLGSARFLGLGPDAADGAASGAADPALTLWLARPGHAPVAFRFADRLPADTAAVVARLGALGLESELLSGDGAPAVRAVAEASGIRDWRAAAGPEDKAARIAALVALGRRPLMVGDGVNDAAALALAHVSVAPDGATDLAQTAADIVLRGGRLAALPGAIALARRARRLARQNLGFSLVYNLVAVPVAVAGLATPPIAAAVMASSSLIVILNALRAGHADAEAMP